jgi:hypothetical protein
MPHAASIRSNAYNHQITPEVLHGMSRRQGRLPPTIVNPPSQRQTEAQLVMDRLLRECFTRKSAWE